MRRERRHQVASYLLMVLRFSGEVSKGQGYSFATLAVVSVTS